MKLGSISMPSSVALLQILTNCLLKGRKCPRHQPHKHHATDNKDKSRQTCFNASRQEEEGCSNNTGCQHQWHEKHPRPYAKPLLRFDAPRPFFEFPSETFHELVDQSNPIENPRQIRQKVCNLHECLKLGRIVSLDGMVSHADVIKVSVVLRSLACLLGVNVDV